MNSSTSSPQASCRTPEEIRQDILELVQEYSSLVHAPQPFLAGLSPVPVSGKVIGAPELQNMVSASLEVGS